MKPLALLVALPVAAFAAEPFRLTSTDLADGKPLGVAQVADTFGCSGGNRSPQLSWSDAPAGTRSFAVTVHDPDAPTGSGWWHWVVFDLPATATSLTAGAGAAKAGSLPAGARSGLNDAGVRGFGGACPPPGDGPHHYVVTVFALKVAALPVPPDASSALIGFMLNANTLARATLTATYQR
jgi:Raf kinase inhibitor-like YbhB/YbcL family protein